jgi:hypothetical protein
MAGVTPLPSTVEPPPTTEDGKFTTCVMQKHAWRDEEVVVASPFTWIPTLFTVSDDGKDVSIEGYINGLGSREQYPILFGLLEQLFKVVMPMLERTAEFDFVPVDPHLSSKRKSQFKCFLFADKLTSDEVLRTTQLCAIRRSHYGGLGVDQGAAKEGGER